MNDLIPINYETEQPTVSARDLYDLLSSEGGLAGTERFSKWFDRYIGYGFKANEDYSTPYKKVRVQTEGSREVSREVEDYDLSIDMAKQICMLQRTEKGKQIRQYFLDIEKAWNTPEQVFARALKMADKTIGKLRTDNEALLERNRLLGVQAVENQKTISELQPKADYVDTILKSKSLVTATQIAKDYGLSAVALNKRLNQLGVQYKVNGQWVLYSKYQGCGYVHSRTIETTRADGRPDVTMQTEWTQRGRLFLYEFLKQNGIVPVIERKEPAGQMSFGVLA